MSEASIDPGSLQYLHDIVVPDPVSWWPPAPGWYGVLLLLLTVTIGMGARAVRRWQRNAYRREALALLDELADREPGADWMVHLAAILKRTALSAFPREQVAALSGAAWLQFLDQTGRTIAFSQGPGQLLADLTYARQPLLPADASALLETVRAWIKQHQLPALTKHPEP